MDSQHASEKSVKEQIYKKDDKESSAVHHSTWLKIIGLLVLFPGSQSVDVKGELHKDVLLPCIVVYKDEFDYSILVVTWQRPENDTLVHVFFHDSSHPEVQDTHYQGRTQIFYEALPNGNASLLLRNLTKSDAGNYICHVILKQSSGYLNQYVNLTVDDAQEAKRENTYWIVIVAVLPVVLISALLAVLVVRRYKFLTRKSSAKDEEAGPLINDIPDPIKKYRDCIMSKKSKHEDIFQRQLIVERGSFTTFQSDNVSFEEKQKIINAKELFTTKNSDFKSKRMLLIGDAGTGKSYLCKWLEEEWAKEEITLYTCIIYVSGKKINKKKEKTSIKEIVEQKGKNLSEVLDKPDVLLILDELDDLVCDADITNTDLLSEKHNNLGIDTYLPLNTLLAMIISKKFLSETDVLIVSRRDSLHKHCTSTFVLQEFNDAEAKNVYDKIGISADRYKSIKDISYNPAFVLMMCNAKRFAEIVHDFISPYELLVSFLRQSLKELHGEGLKKENILQLANESYENLVKGDQNNIETTKSWGQFLNFFSCSWTSKYLCEFFRDMIATLHCVWQQKMEECLDFWLFGANIGRSPTCPLLFVVAEEHHTKYYNFIRFLMRLLPYPDYDSLYNNTPNLDNNLRKLLSDYFSTNLKERNENYEKLTVVHCVFELHDDCVTKELSTIEQFSLVNTSLNSLDIRAFIYCFKDVRLQKLDLRLCALTDKDVEQLKSIIKNTDYVLLSSNRLTLKTGTFLEGLLQEPLCFIEKLSLGTNDLGPRGAQALWRALEHNKSLKSLYVYDNNIGDDGTIGMVEHLLNNNSLMELHLCQNAFGQKAIENIQILKDNKPKLKVVVTITEDLELFEYAEKRVEGLFSTWRNYNQEWLIKLLDVVKADLQNKDWKMDANLTQERVDKLREQIESILNNI